MNDWNYFERNDTGILSLADLFRQDRWLNTNRQRDGNEFQQIEPTLQDFDLVHEGGRLSQPSSEFALTDAGSNPRGLHSLNCGSVVG